MWYNRMKDKNHMIISKGYIKIICRNVTKFDILLSWNIFNIWCMEGIYLNIIKFICDKPTTNIILDGERLKALPLRSGTRLVCSLFNIALEVLARAIEQEKEIESMLIRNQFSSVTQSCPTLWDTLDGSLPGSFVHGIFPGKSTGVSCHFLL